MKNWKYVLKKLNENRDSTQEKLTKVNTPESLYVFWVNRKNSKYDVNDYSRIKKRRHLRI